MKRLNNFGIREGKKTRINTVVALPRWKSQMKNKSLQSGAEAG